MFKFLKEFFHLSHKESRGAVTLLFLLLLFFVLPKVYFYYKEPKVVEDDKDFNAWISEIETRDSLNRITKNEKDIVVTEKFPFDFNSVSYQEMIKLGIDKKTANILLKFRGKGAKFYKKEDVMKIYGFSDELYTSLENYIIYPNIEKQDVNQFSEKNFNKKPKENSPIDPNTATWKELVSLGIESKTANILLKFRKNGATFYSKEDLLKVYGFTEELYTELESYIIFPEKVETHTTEKEKIANEEIPTLFIIDINKADTSDFIKLSGIGKFYAKTILEYRTKLGGFYKTEQIKEAYGIKEELYSKLEMNFTIETPVFRKIDINNTTFKELIRHPYIDKETTIQILNLHKQIGGFLSINDLKSYSVLNEKEFEVLKHYLEVGTK